MYFLNQSMDCILSTQVPGHITQSNCQEMSRVEEPILEQCHCVPCSPLRSSRSLNLCWTTRSENWRLRFGLYPSVPKETGMATFPSFSCAQQCWICMDLPIYTHIWQFWWEDDDKQLDFGLPCFLKPTCFFMFLFPSVRETACGKCCPEFLSRFFERVLAPGTFHCSSSNSSGILHVDLFISIYATPR